MFSKTGYELDNMQGFPVETLIPYIPWSHYYQLPKKYLATNCFWIQLRQEVIALISE